MSVCLFGDLGWIWPLRSKRKEKYLTPKWPNTAIEPGFSILHNINGDNAMKKYEKNLNDQSRAAMTPTEVEISLHLSSGDAKAIRQSPRWGKEEKKVTKKIFFFSNLACIFMWSWRELSWQTDHYRGIYQDNFENYLHAKALKHSWRKWQHANLICGLGKWKIYIF